MRRRDWLGSRSGVGEEIRSLSFCLVTLLVATRAFRGVAEMDARRRICREGMGPIKGFGFTLYCYDRTCSSRDLMSRGRIKSGIFQNQEPRTTFQLHWGYCRATSLEYRPGYWYYGIQLQGRSRVWLSLQSQDGSGALALRFATASSPSFFAHSKIST